MSANQPRHVAVIMDGNGRWAQRRGLPRNAGHAKGADAVRAIVRRARELGIECLTLYAFSQQNWRRPTEEVDGVMRLLEQYLREERAELRERDIRVTTIGNTAQLPTGARALLDAIALDTPRDEAEMTLCLALSYGGRESIIAAVKTIVEAVQEGDLPFERIDEATLSIALTTNGLPPVDLLIRTSGEMRLSNFLLWELAYAELYFTETLWPDFKGEDLDRALEVFGKRDRRYGGVTKADANGNPLVI